MAGEWVAPKQYITFNPMQYAVQKQKTDDVDLFAEYDSEEVGTQPITTEMYADLMEYLEKHNKPVVFLIHIVYNAVIVRNCTDDEATIVMVDSNTILREDMYNDEH